MDDQVAVEDGPRLRGRFRRQEDQQPLAFGSRFCAAFLLGLIDFSRPLSWRNLDLLALLSFSVSLWFFNHGNIFTSVPLAYPHWRISSHAASGSVWRKAREGGAAIWKPAILLAAAVFLMGFGSASTSRTRT